MAEKTGRVLIPFDQIEAAIAHDEMAGWCLACGSQGEDTYEPDARRCRCTACGAMEVYGAEEIVLMGRAST